MFTVTKGDVSVEVDTPYEFALVLQLFADRQFSPELMERLDQRYGR